jgi:hypothetical protein
VGKGPALGAAGKVFDHDDVHLLQLVEFLLFAVNITVSAFVIGKLMQTES